MPYLLDANVFIQAKNLHYGMDFCPAFWDWLIHTTPVSAAANKSVTTIEGLSAEGTHPVQVAWQEFDVPQCGYCQAGQMMSACVLLAKKARPTDADIDTAMNGNLCRCGTYLRIREAIHRAAELTAAKG